jgi:hypothetical protein
MRSLKILNNLANPIQKFSFKSEHDINRKILIYLINVLNNRLEKSPTKWIVEFGVHGKDDGVLLDFLIRDGYNSVLIEGDKYNFAEVEKIYSKISNQVTCINKYVESTGVNSLDNLLKTTSCPEIFDILLIDVDSIDYQIWESFKNYSPTFVIIEFNNEYGPKLERIHNIPLNNWVGESNFAKGSSIKSIIELGKRKDYSLITVTRNNAYFIKKEFLHAFHLEEVNIDDIFHFSLHEIGRLNPSILSFKQLFQYYFIYGLPLLIKKLKKKLGKN